ncbi:transglutaminase family protein [Zoogloea sp. LCSB751]|uniref:transglutaminase-like domain-containing protein n=1 Tax=Zoogloea sp. LCSB751 TaxID=1965277 RepID=UPI0009A4FF11|nr:transglutaminase family protein [Zoogloea sp. LCSB751]
MVRLKFSVELNYEVAPPGCDFIFNIHAAHTRYQRVVTEMMELGQFLLPQVHTDATTGNRYMRLKAEPGRLRLRYSATVDLQHHVASPESVPEVPVARLPADVLTYLYPSRYCQSDRLYDVAGREFGTLTPGYGRVRAICEWVGRHVTFKSNTTNASTSALDTLGERVGVCRDFAHLMIALCRALNIPARFVAGIDYGADPALGPSDFHAYVEVYLGDRWYLFDPSATAIPMGLMRFGTGRDAADVSFATIFGPVRAEPPRIAIEAVSDPLAGFELPRKRTEALSTDDGSAVLIGTRLAPLS